MQSKRYRPHSSKQVRNKRDRKKKRELSRENPIRFECGTKRKGFILPAPGSAAECRPPPMLSTIRACRIRWGLETGQLVEKRRAKGWALAAATARGERRGTVVAKRSGKSARKKEGRRVVGGRRESELEKDGQRVWAEDGEESGGGWRRTCARISRVRSTSYWSHPSLTPRILLPLPG